MAGKKRTADGETTSPRHSKAAKVSDHEDEPSSPKSKASPKAKAKSPPKTMVPTTEQFKAHALPLHVHVTHTPPTAEVPGSAADPTPNLSTDPGFVASMTLAPSEFSTGSLGWKGSRRVAVELVNTDGAKETVMVMMSFNATVVGSKPSAKPAAKGSRKSSRAKAKKTEDEDEDHEEDED